MNYPCLSFLALGSPSLLLVLTVACGSGADSEPDRTLDAGAQPTPPTAEVRPTPRADAGTASEVGPVVPTLDAGGSSPVSLALLPWREGNRWTYRVSGDGEVSTKVITVGSLERVGGSGLHQDELANRTTTRKGETDETVSWQAAVGDRVLRYRELSFGGKTGLQQRDEHWSPYKLHIDGTAAHVLAGASWVEEYQETKQGPDAAPVTTTVRDAWSVDAVAQTVTVPAGTFEAVVFVKGGGGGQKTYWYAPGIGKVKETGGQTEELVSYEVKP